MKDFLFVKCFLSVFEDGDNDDAQFWHRKVEFMVFVILRIYYPVTWWSCFKKFIMWE